MNLIHTYKQTNKHTLFVDFFLFKVSFGCFPRDAIIKWGIEKMVLKN